MDIEHKGVRVVIKQDETAFADYPNEEEIVKILHEKRKAKETGKVRVLVSKPEICRVYYPKDSLFKLFTHIEEIMK